MPNFLDTLVNHPLLPRLKEATPEIIRMQLMLIDFTPIPGIQPKPRDFDAATRARVKTAQQAGVKTQLYRPNFVDTGIQLPEFHFEGVEWGELGNFINFADTFEYTKEHQHGHHKHGPRLLFQVKSPSMAIPARPVPTADLFGENAQRIREHLVEERKLVRSIEIKIWLNPVFKEERLDGWRYTIRVKPSKIDPQGYLRLDDQKHIFWEVE